MFLEGKNALVTGGGRGIGRAIALQLASEGARVAVTGRTIEQLESVAKEVNGIAIRADLGDRASTDVAIKTIEERLGRVDILVNNAGIADAAPVKRTTDEMWDRILEVNVTSAFRLIRALLPGMTASGWGRIINIASNAGLTGYAYTAAYCASKHAMVGLTRALAVDVASKGVTVNALCPGWVETDMARAAVDRIAEATGRSSKDSKAELEAMSPQGRMLTADEVAHMALTLCSDGSRGVHGQCIVIDGGALMT